MSAPGIQREAARILVVDDDTQIVEIISLMRDATGHRVLRAATGEECVRMATAERPQIILLDVQLPGTDWNATAASFAQHVNARSPRRKEVVHELP